MSGTRTQRIRIWLSKQDGSCTSRDVLNAVDPHAGINIISSAIDHLVKRGDVLRKQVGGVLRYKLSAKGTQAANDDPFLNRAPRRPAPTPKPTRATTAKPAPPPPPPAMRAAIDNAVRSAGTRLAPKPTASTPKLAPARNRVAPIACSMSGIPDAHRAASDRIAADIAAFEARGGRIERLGTTRLFHDIASENDDE